MSDRKKPAPKTTAFVAPTKKAAAAPKTDPTGFVTGKGHNRAGQRYCG
jgi:hypothetical protein